MRELLRYNEVGSQDELVAILEAEGFRTTQATLSRDLRELGARKVDGHYRLPDGRNDGSARRGLATALQGVLVSVARGGTTVVVRTGPGLAQRAAMEITAADLPGMLGTIAESDTVFIAAAGIPQARAIESMIRGDKAR